ncbi:hypothetical protein [Pontimicrobium sp. SW4]|uniref:Lipoprotein n=1 Tax=Pontimicrobium sp. SW4 TaxID=3153519 RepID=A0AAU7BUZ0_9FLAO
MSFKFNYYILLILLFTLSCKDSSNSTANKQSELSKNLLGKYHFLEDTGTQIYLPEAFERYSLTKYQRLLDSLTTKKEYKIETERLDALGKMDGSLYIYYNKDNGATYTINTRPYFAFTKDDAPQLLGLITSSNDKVKENSDAVFTKMTAKYGGDINQQLFKTVYKVSGKSMKNDVYNTSYIISSKGKTVFIQLSTLDDINFDPYIEKMLLK